MTTLYVLHTDYERLLRIGRLCMYNEQPLGQSRYCYPILLKFAAQFCLFLKRAKYGVLGLT